MFDQRGARILRGDRTENALQRLRKDAQRSGTYDVLDSLPVPGSFVFHKTKRNGRETIELLLGERPNPNGSASRAWACIDPSTEKTGRRPPMVFYDEERSANGMRTIRYPRSASSLLRKASELQPPFCFLQHDPIDGATKVQEMLAAIVLYFAATRDIDICTWQWDGFNESLLNALNHIQSRDTYNQWRHKQKLAALSPSSPGRAAEEIPQKDREQHANSDQMSDPIADQTNTPSSVKAKGFCGTVRSRGSAMVIRPKTSLAKLKQELGDRKFKLLDNIPSKPMRISRHNIGGSLFPYRMLIGKAKYQSTGEVIEVYAYIDHEGTKPASMIFMSHDSEGLEQTYDVNLLRDGVDLVDHLEYLNTLKKDSYKNDAKSARTAKLRSLICYYFFIAENEGMIGNTKVDINGGFCKRLCAVCHELGKKDWCNAEHDDVEDTDEGSSKNVDVQQNGQRPAQYGTESRYDNVELTQRGESETESSRIMRLSIRPEVLTRGIESKSVESDGDSPDQSILSIQSSDDPIAIEALVEQAVAVEVALRPSSQIAHEDSQRTTDVVASYHAPSSGRFPGSRTADITSTKAKFSTIIADETAESILLHRFHASEQIPVFVDVCSSYTKADTNAMPKDQNVQIVSSLRPGNDRDESNSKVVPALTPNHFSLSTSCSITGTTKVSGQPADNIAARSKVKRSSTPEIGSGRDLRSKAMSVNVPGDEPHAFAAVDAVFISDDEDKDLALLPLRSAFDRMMGAKSLGRGHIVDLTQLSSSPRGKKRKSCGPLYLSDSGDDTIVEIDGSEWRRIPRGGRK